MYNNIRIYKWKDLTDNSIINKIVKSAIKEYLRIQPLKVTIKNIKVVVNYDFLDKYTLLTSRIREIELQTSTETVLIKFTNLAFEFPEPVTLYHKNFYIDRNNLDCECTFERTQYLKFLGLIDVYYMAAKWVNNKSFRKKMIKFILGKD